MLIIPEEDTDILDLLRIKNIIFLFEKTFFFYLENKLLD